ncbi:MAG: phenylalanine--tRNA ligase subunit beta [Defluviitaleaceae bacterium]|nr:phenylalanine--tRNA ligase subunit beta [Defluviitaleaceae bacterium]
MNIPLSWLRTFVDIDVPIRQFMEDITLSGTVAESHTPLGTEIDKVVVGRVESINKHPDADKLVITKIDIGSESMLQIVTGATNLHVGDYVPVATHGASLVGGLKIKKGKLRGEVSEGMLCSIEELGYTRQDYPESPEDGIYVFQTPQPLGADVRPILELIDDVIEFEINSNRSDCQSVIGIAREIAATYGKTLSLPSIKIEEKAEGNASDFVEVEIKNPNLCPRYVARVVKNVRIEPSPQWLRRRLTMAGIRPINNIVDITNYVMLEYGQPLHAFDIDHISKGSSDAQHKIIVRNATPNEKFTTLDGVERVLDETMLVIADPEKAVAIAGIMGGENSKVTGEASAVLFESANFDGTNIRLSSKKLGMRTDASGKFEKGIDPNLPLAAVNRAMELVEQLACGEVVSGVVDNYPGPRNPITVEYKPENINRRLGTDIRNMEDIFLNRVDINATNGNAVIPTFRSDITSEADISEEVARLYGYNNIPINKAQRNIFGGGKNSLQHGTDMIKRTMVALGYSEALTSSFEGPKIFDKLNIPSDSPLREAVNITNPLGEDFSVMRTSPLNGMLQSLSLNFNRRNAYARLFELVKVYLPRHKDNPGTLPEELTYLTIGAYSREGKGMDFFDIKGDVEELFARLGIKNIKFMPSSNVPQLHPGRTAEIVIQDESFSNLGQFSHIGELHPDIAEVYEIGTKVYVAIIPFKPLVDGINNAATYIPLPKYPAITRDIALQVKENITAAEIEEAIRKKAGSLLVELTLFDVYQGKQIEEGYKSMAYSLFFRAEDRTLTDSEVAKPMESILKYLEETLGIQLRDR